MASTINTNVTSLIAQRNLGKTQDGLQTAIERLSSGLRINSAKDDAAGLAISTRFSSQIRGLDVAARNANDGISMAQVAEGALGQMSDSLQRIRDLAVQAANATNSDDDRIALNAEAQQLISEINRLSDDTNFNGLSLLDGTVTEQTFQIGANSGETFKFTINDLGTDVLGAAETAGVSAVGNANAMSSGDLVLNGVNITGSSAADDTASTNNAASSAIAKAAAINKSSDLTGVTAVVDETVAAGSEQVTPAAAANGTVTINGITTGNIALGTGDLSANRVAVIEAVNLISGQTGITAVDTGEPNTGINLVAEDGRNIELSFTAAAGTFDGTTTGLAEAGTSYGSFTLSSQNGEPIKIEEGTGDLANVGLAAGSYAIDDATVSAIERSSDGTIVTTVDVAGGTAMFADGDSMSVNVSGTDYTIHFDDADSTAVTDGATFATLLQNKVNNAVGEDVLSVNAVFDAAGGAAEHLTLQSKDRITFDLGGIAGGVAELTDIHNQTIGGPDALREGDLVINGVAVQAPRSGADTFSNIGAATSNNEASGIAVAAAVNDATEATGVSATVNSTVVGGGGTSTTGTAGEQGRVYLNGQTFTMTLLGDAEQDRAAALDKINALSGQTGVVAEDTGNSLRLVAADGRNISISIDTNEDVNTTNGFGAFQGSDIGLDDSQAGIFEVDATDRGTTGAQTTISTSTTDLAKYAETTTSTVTLHAAGKFTLEAGENGSEELEELGFFVGEFGGQDSGQFIQDLDISSFEGANQALSAIDNALGQINSQRADLGAIQNRLSSTIDSLTNTSNNLSAANSRILDTDFARETANLTKQQILSQAGTAMLAQANQIPQGVLSLLG